MEIDWSLVKKKTLWSYEDLIAKLQEVLAYHFVQQYYNHSMPEAQKFALSIRRGYLGDRGEMAGYLDAAAAHLARLEACGIGSYSALISTVAKREQCAAFLSRTSYDFEVLIETLNYLLRWVLPFKSPLRELVDADDPNELELLKALRLQKVSSTLDLLENGRSTAGRLELAENTSIPFDLLSALVHKADITRLAYVRGKTVRHLCGGGYDTLAKLAAADLPEMEARMDAYYRTLGKSLSDFKAVIPLTWMIGGAKVVPPIVDP